MSTDEYFLEVRDGDSEHADDEREDETHCQAGPSIALPTSIAMMDTS